ncbi:hypothetical protein LJ655_00960 [Paraburkholderia sp. MMS20-SJTN17]|uniref:Uncharacterized protein n=1 Tax=Paraburkholderia translucens TaxID=2886945 RepID=A0ABS8K6V0_9BURK|nr:hypothetical protein [Paraburkholderia sp. MMS20-SJTN17]MCC8400473.1 hypothetical protein [Paraburkholderia sp. MMS20-SJTN17]
MTRLEPKAFAVRDAVSFHRSPSIEPAGSASITLKKTLLSSAIRLAVDASRSPHQSMPARDTTWRTSSAIGRFVDMPASAVGGQTQQPPAHGTTDEASAIDGQLQLPLTHAKAKAANASGRETQPPLTHAEATDASSIDHGRQPPRHAASSPGIASHAIPTQIDNVSPHRSAMNAVQRTRATSIAVKPQASVRQTASLPLRHASEPRDPREAYRDGAPGTAWTERGIAPALPTNEPPFVDRAAEQYGVVSPGTQVTRDAGATATASTSSPTTSATAGKRATPEAGSAANTGVDASELAEQAWQLILDKLAIEQERRGYSSWA